jgi:hypothetical protein
MDGGGRVFQSDVDITRKLKRENTLRRRGDIGGVMSSENGDSPAAGSMRAKMVEKFVEALGDEEPNAASIAAGIESEVHTRFSGQGYAAKGRSLIFNLKKNGDLRARVLSGDYAVDALVTASASELAVEALKKQRQASLDRYVAQVCRHPLCRPSLAQCLPSRDVLAQVLILQFPTFLEQRSLSGDEQVVGWAAGTSGKVCVARPFPRCMPLISSNLGGGLTHAQFVPCLCQLDWSHKYEKEKAGAEAVGAAIGDLGGDQTAEESHQADAHVSDDDDDDDEEAEANDADGQAFSDEDEPAVPLSSGSGGGGRQGNSRPAATGGGGGGSSSSLPGNPTSPSSRGRAASLAARPRPAKHSAADDIPVDVADFINSAPKKQAAGRAAAEAGASSATDHGSKKRKLGEPTRLADALLRPCTLMEATRGVAVPGATLAAGSEQEAQQAAALAVEKVRAIVEAHRSYAAQ